MTMKINVMYRGIVYRVRGMKVLCSVVTAVIVLLVAIVALGIWMLVTAYTGDKFNTSSNTTSIPGITMNLELNRTTQTTSTVPGIDFNAPSSTLQDTAYPTHDPSSSEERDLVNEAVGHLAGATPGKPDVDTSREPGPDPAFGLFSGLLNLGLSNEEPIVDLPISPAPIPGTWRPLEDNVVELSDSRPVIVEPPPRQFNISSSSPPDTLDRRVDSDVLSESSSKQPFNPSIVDKGNAGYVGTGPFGTSFTNSFPYRPESYETNYENTFPSQPSSSVSDVVSTGPTEDSSIYSVAYRPTDTSGFVYNNVRRPNTSFQQSANQQPDTSEPSLDINRPLLTVDRQEFSNRYSDISFNLRRPDNSEKGQVENAGPIGPYIRQPDSFEYTDNRQSDRNINTETKYNNRYTDTVDSESPVIFDDRLRPDITNYANQFHQYDESLDYNEYEYDSDNFYEQTNIQSENYDQTNRQPDNYDQTNRQPDNYDQTNRQSDNYDQTNRQSENYDQTNRRSDNYDQTNRRSDNYETKFIDSILPVRQGNNNRPIYPPSTSGIPAGLIPQYMDPMLHGAGLPLPGMFGLGSLMNQRIRGGHLNRNIQNVQQYPNRQLYNQRQHSFVERQGTVDDNGDEETNDKEGYEIQDSDSEHYNDKPYLPEEELNDPNKQDFNYYDNIKDSGLQKYSENVHPDIPQEYLQNGNIPNGFTIPPGFKIPSNVPENLPLIPGLNRGNNGPYLNGPGSHIQDMLYYYNKHEKLRPSTESTQVITDQNNVNTRAGLPQDQTNHNYSGPAVVGYGNQPFRLSPNHDRKEIFEHFMNVYDSTGSTPGIHEDRGPGPDKPQPYDIQGRRPNRGPGIPVLTTEGHQLQSDKNSRRIDSNSNFNHNDHATNPYSRITTIVPRPNVRGPRPNGQGYGNLATRPDAQSPAQINPDTEDPIIDDYEIISNKPQIPNTQQGPTGQPESDLQLRPGTYKRPGNLHRQNSQQRPNNQQRPNSQQRPNNQAGFNQRPTVHPRPNSRPGMPNRPSGNQRVGNRPLQNPDRRLWTGLSNPQQDLSDEQVPENHRPFLGPLHDIFEYSKKLAASLLSPFYPAEEFKNSTAEYMKNTVELLEDYNKVFKTGDVSTADVLPDMFDDRPDRNERLMLLETDELESLGPIEMTLITWTFLDFWEFMIEKVGTLSRDDLRILENRLERLRRQKDKTLTKTIINATITALPHNGQTANISQALALSEQEDPDYPDYETEGPEARMWDPLGLFDSQQKVQFMEFAIQVLFKFGRVYLRKQYALDCMMLLFCKDLNSKSRKDGMESLAAKIKSVGLKVLTVREERDGEMDTIGEIWKALTAWDTLQCDAMFPKCDGTKALEIVNEVALGD